jgi:site-specific DNA-methyltransferase (adenine-specific)
VTPYYQDDLVTIYHGDAAEALPSVGMVDAVITDPPYGLDFQYGTGRSDSEDGYIERLWPVIEEAERHVRPGGAVVVYQAAKHARRWAEWFPRDWRPIALPKSFTQMLPVSPTWATDYALLWWVGEAPKYEDWMPRPNRDWYVSRVPNFGLGRRSIPHPCPRPVEQVRYLVSLLCPPGGTVLDPFLGSGTTALAAKDTGRRAIGIEVEEKWCALSVARCSQEVLGLSA